MVSLYYNIKNWQGSFRPPPVSDIRWRVLGLLLFFVIMGLVFLGFSRQPVQVFLLITAGAFLDVLLNGLIKGRKVFPLSAMISCCSLVILLNYAYGLYLLWVPVFVCIASKYLVTLNGKHFFNPSLFAICFCLLFGEKFITIAPSYQWYGNAETAGLMLFFVATGALLLFIFKINRTWLIASFLIVFLLQTALRAYILKEIIPWETLFIGSIINPGFYLFTFYMITDPATSPNDRKSQLLVGASIAMLDLVFHLVFSYYTFFYAGITVAGIRYVYFQIKKYLQKRNTNPFTDIYAFIPRYIFLFILGIPVFYAFQSMESNAGFIKSNTFELTPVSTDHSGIGWEKSNILNETDPRIAHVNKWLLSVGDAGAAGDVNQDGLPDLFLTQPLKTKQWRGKLFINQGNFQFKKVVIPDLEKYIKTPKKYGLPSFAFFLDYDNDSDKDLFIGFGYGNSRLFKNQLTETGTCTFEEVRVPFLENNNTVCITATGFDFNHNGRLDILLTNALNPYLPDYDERVPLNIFNLPEPAYEGDRRMFHFMHESWHNARNGGKNHLLINTADTNIFKHQANDRIHLTETGWSLAIGTLDMNDDGYTDIYIANDFGRNDPYLNVQGKYFKRQEGNYYGAFGLDTYKGMNVSVGDMDRNGKEDIYISNVHHSVQKEGSLLYMNETGQGSSYADFNEQASVLNALNPNRFGWGASVVDLNQDGWPDIIQANGMVGDSWDKKYDKRVDYWYFQAQIARTGPEIHSYADKWADIRGTSIYENEADRIYINNEGKGFVDVSEALGFTHRANTRGVITADFNNDGAVDILVTNQFGGAYLYKNNVKDHQWIGLHLEGNGNTTNKDAVGTKVTLRYLQNGNPTEQVREVRLTSGFSAMSDKRLLFGLGHNKNHIDSINALINWHNGETEIVEGLAVNKYHNIRQK